MAEGRRGGAFAGSPDHDEHSTSEEVRPSLSAAPPCSVLVCNMRERSGEEASAVCVVLFVCCVYDCACCGSMTGSLGVNGVGNTHRHRQGRGVTPPTREPEREDSDVGSAVCVAMFFLASSSCSHVQSIFQPSKTHIMHIHSNRT
jgi:hypothetical protein